MIPGGATSAYTYDSVGNLSSMINVAGTLTYDYNNVNLVHELAEPGGAVTIFAYDDNDNRTLTTYPNGVTQAAAYDDSFRLTTIEGKRGLVTRRTGWGPSKEDSSSGSSTTWPSM